MGGTRSQRLLDRVQEYCCEHRNPFMQGFYLVGNPSPTCVLWGSSLPLQPVFSILPRTGCCLRAQLLLLPSASLSASPRLSGKLTSAKLSVLCPQAH